MPQSGVTRSTAAASQPRAPRRRAAVEEPAREDCRTERESREPVSLSDPEVCRRRSHHRKLKDPGCGMSNNIQTATSSAIILLKLVTLTTQAEGSVAVR